MDSALNNSNLNYYNYIVKILDFTYIKIKLKILINLILKLLSEN